MELELAVTGASVVAPFVLRACGPRRTAPGGFDLCGSGQGSVVQPSLRTRLRWRLQELRDANDAKVIAGLLLLLALTFGGFFAARTVARASADPRAATRMVTLRQNVRVGGQGRAVTRWRLRRLYSQAQTLMRTQTIQTPGGIRLVTHPVIRYRVVYRKGLVTRPGETRTVTRQVTDSRVVTVTRQVTMVATTTVVSTKTDTLPITITVTVP
jgi:hypothetical protein